MVIRHANPDTDAAACAAIYAPFVVESAVSFDEQPPTGADFARKIEKLSASYPFLVAAHDDGTIAGFAYASPYRERAAYRWSCESSVYVHDDHRRLGVGKRLYDALIDLLRRQGMRVVVAGITQPNPGSVALHRSCGFDHVGTFEKIGYKYGAWRDVAFLSLQLAPGASDAEPPDPGPPARLP